MEAHLSPTQPTQVNKITTSCEIYGGPHDTQYCMEDPEQAFVEYALSRTDEARCNTFKPKQNNLGDTHNPSWRSHPNLRWRQPQNSQNNFSNPPNWFQSNSSIPNHSFNNLPQSFNSQSNLEGLPNEPQNEKPEEEEEKDNPENIHVNPPTPPDPSVSFITKKVLKLNSFFESLGLVPQSSHTKLVCTKGDDGDIMFIKIVQKKDDSHKEEPKAGEQEVEYFDVLPTRSELAYHKYLMCGPIPLIFLRNPIITKGCPSNLKIPCHNGYVHVKRAYIDLNSPLNMMTHMMYNWIMRIKLDPTENSNRGISNFTGRIKRTHVFVGNFTYITNFMIVEDISSIIDHRLSQVVLGRPFIEMSNMTHDPPEGVVRFTNGNNEVAYKMPHKIEQYNSLSNLKKSTQNRSTLEIRRTKEEK
uniref:MAK10-like protein n=1 Tax=Tanacetum cinerariifolium TaxID=118510 RepID=A0A6L2KBT1_TANCI|nr:MAK10-like protein [Tanacetum cinerariifolium]